MTYKRKGLRQNRTKNKEQKEKYTEWLKARSLTDKTFKSRTQYKKSNIAKIKLIKANNSPVKLSSPKHIHFFPNPQHNRAKFRIDKEDWHARIEGKDFVTLKGDLLQMHETFYRSEGKVFKQVFFN